MLLYMDFERAIISYCNMKASWVFVKVTTFVIESLFDDDGKAAEISTYMEIYRRMTKWLSEGVFHFP